MTGENDAYCWFISVTKHSNTDWNSIVDSESMIFTANNYLMVNYSTFIILMIIIKTPGMFFVQCFTATSVTDLRWRSLIALALNCLLGEIANHSLRICALILLLRIDLPKFHHRVVHLAHDFMCKELRPMISSSLYILIDTHWETFGAQIIVSLFHKNTLFIFVACICFSEGQMHWAMCLDWWLGETNYICAGSHA